MISDFAPVKDVKEARKKRMDENRKRLIKCCKCEACQPDKENDVDLMKAIRRERG